MKNLKNTTLPAFFRRIRKFLPKGNQNNLKVVLLCILAATTFWFFNALNKKNYTTKISYPVRFDYNKDSLIAISPLPDNILIEVTGGGWNMLRKYLKVDSQPIMVPLENPVETEIIPSQNLIPLVSQKFGDLQVNFVEPDTIYVNFEIKSSKEVRVEADSANINLEDNYYINSPVSVMPEKVTVTGPLSQIQSMDNTITFSVPEEEIDDDFEEEVYLNYPLPPKVSINPRQVNVQFKVGRYVREEQTVQLVRKNFPGNDSIKLNSSTVNVIFRVPEEKMEDGPFDFRIVADYQNINKVDSSLRPEIDEIPGFVNIIEITPEKLQVTYGP